MALYGGLGPKTQIEQINKGVDIIVATPGRFMDIYLAGHLVTKQLQVLVLDEADKMMDMGFMPQINRILECQCRLNGKTCFFRLPCLIKYISSQLIF